MTTKSSPIVMQRQSGP